MQDDEILDAMIFLIQGYALERGQYVSRTLAREIAVEELNND